ncbi:tetratricopeptide repeat protein [Streptomyces microflavus]|uniref:tetratricopeptide repeat protein n=1 Tax=Streptomyces microflavus TaxID=1919 RepID=UPI0036BC5564
MKSDDGKTIRRPRRVRRPNVAPGPLSDLKQLLYELYLDAQTPTLDAVVAEIAADDALPGSPSRDTVARILSGPAVPAQQADVTSVGVILARLAAWDEEDVSSKVRSLWLQARLAARLGQPIRSMTDPFILEVHRAIEAPASPNSTGTSSLPTYVPRSHDDQLRAVVSKALAGKSMLAVLVGGSSAGKTRACWEALQQIPDDWRLWHPIDPDRPEAALKELDQVGPRTVIWLNESQHYLLTPNSSLGERVAARLRSVLRDPSRSPVLVLGTIWPQYWAALTRPPAEAEIPLEPHPQARALMTGRGIQVPDAFSAADLATLHSSASADPRLHQAATHASHGQITQYLAGVPALLERYRTAPPTARALIDAAIDARRVGQGVALPHGLLEMAVPGYLTDHQWDQLSDDWLEEALAFTSAPCRGARGPLTRIRPRPGTASLRQPSYRLSDYLEQHGRASRSIDCPPAELWEAILISASPDTLIDVAESALERGLLRLAARLCIRAAEEGRPDALPLVAMLTKPAMHVHNIAKRARLRNDLSVGLPERIPYQRAAPIPSLELRSIEFTVDQMLRRGRDDEAVAWLHDQCSVSEPGTLRLMGDLLHKLNRTDEAHSYWERATLNGDRSALRRRATVLRKSGFVDQAISWLREHMTPLDVASAAMGAEFLEATGRVQEAIVWWKQAAASGNQVAIWHVATLLEEHGRLDSAVQWLCTAPHTNSVNCRRASDLLREAGRHADALKVLRESLLHRDEAVYLEGAGRFDEAVEAWRQATLKGDYRAAIQTSRLLQKMQLTDAAIAWLRSSAEIGYARDLAWEVDLLRSAGRIEEASALECYGWEPDGSIAEPWKI